MCEAREVSHSLQVALLGAYTHPTRNFRCSELMAYADIILTHVRPSWMYVDIFYDGWGQESLQSRPTRPYSQFRVRVWVNTQYLAGSALMGYANVIITQTCHFCMYVDIFYNVWGQETLRSRPTRAYSGLLAPTRNLGLGFK
jgi:hypothetical protein